VRVVDAKVLGDQFLVAPHLVGRSHECASTGIKDDGLIRDIERQQTVLLDKDNGLPSRLQPADDLADFGDDQRR
jgi:hypothetical protein